MLNLQGQVEMDASIMDGQNLNSGAVALVRDVKNPIKLARSVAENSPHVFLAGSGASEFAATVGIVIVPPESLISDYAKAVLETFKLTGGTQEVLQINNN